MAFSKSFPKKNLAGYPEWEEVTISNEDEKLTDEKARMENIALFSQCIDDAKGVLIKKGLMENDANVVNAAVALFEKRASHSIYFKERKAKEKFDTMQR